MKLETCLEVQAYVDGELAKSRQSTVASLCENDPEARRLKEALEGLRTTVRAHEPEYSVRDSREFYWSQIQRRIETAERAESRSKAPSLSVLSRLMRWLVPVAGLAAVALVFTLRDQSPARAAYVAGKASENGEHSAVVYRSEADGVTVHWIN